MSAEALLATGYALALTLGVGVLEWLSAHTHRRALLWRTAGFDYDEDHDAWTCPISHPVKGAANPSNSVERLYHVPGGEAYAKTQPDRCYTNAEEAREDGTRRAQR